MKGETKAQTKDTSLDHLLDYSTEYKSVLLLVSYLEYDSVGKLLALQWICM